MNEMRVSSNYAYFRLLGYATILALQGGNSIAMFLALRGDVMKDPDIERFYSLQWVYITIWNVFFQLFYACLGILCDLPILLEIKEHKLLKYLKLYRQVLFPSLMVPTGVLISSIFWSVYLYDREMIFPSFIDKVLSQVSNHIMHTAIVPVVLWEFMFLPRTEPKSHRLNLIHTYGFFVCYLYVLFSTFAFRGIWPYPVLKHTYGTIYFPLVFIFIVLSAYIVYYAQWPINQLLWGSSIKISKKKK